MNTAPLSARSRRLRRSVLSGAIGLAIVLVAVGCSSSTSSKSTGTKSASAVGGSTSSSTASAVPAGSSSAAAAGTSSLASLLPDSLRSSGVLRVGTDPELRPAEFVDPNTHQIVGYDIDLMNAIAAKLGLKVQFVQSAYAGLIPGLLAGRADILGGAVTDTLAREQQVNFVGYMKNYQILLALAANPHKISSDPLSTCGLRVGLEIGGVDAAYGPVLTKDCSDAGKPAPIITNYTGQSSKTLALQSGRVDATFYTPIAFPALQQATNNAFLSFKVDGFPVQLLGIAAPKNSPQLQNAILEALKAVQADGTYDTIYKKWAVSDLEFLTPGINLTSTNPSLIK